MKKNTAKIEVLAGSITLLMLFLPAVLCSAQQLKSYRGEVKGGYNFWVYTPKDYDTATEAKKPVILFLHGASLRGSNLDLALRYGPIDALRRGRCIDAVIVNPQCPARCRWEPDKIIKVVDWVQQHYAVDTNRLYVFGMSLGGYGTLDFCGAFPHRVAAAIAMCGGSNQKNYCGLNELPLWIIHGTADRAVSISSSQRVIDAMKACGPADRLIFTKLPGQGHGALSRIFYISEPYDWLMKHSLVDSARAVNRDFSIDVPNIKQAYSGLTRVSIPTQRGKGNDTTLKESLPQKTTVYKNDPCNAEGAKYHSIRRGDNLCSIARRYHTSVKKICSLNKGLNESTTLRVGRRIRVK
ncbi:MAG: prolyl oligopeptidase family serine peptidase [Bacteroidales bacterium]|nr:prolyl oligopeptidase family serine peptidase [Bacteroidales bacterium]